MRDLHREQLSKVRMHADDLQTKLTSSEQRLLQVQERANMVQTWLTMGLVMAGLAQLFSHSRWLMAALLV